MLSMDIFTKLYESKLIYNSRILKDNLKINKNGKRKVLVKF